MCGYYLCPAGGQTHGQAGTQLPLQKGGLGDRRRTSCAGGSSRGAASCLAGLLSLPACPLPPPLQVFVVELLGRRFLLLLGFSLCFTACCVLTAALALQVRRGGCGGGWSAQSVR